MVALAIASPVGLLSNFKVSWRELSSRFNGREVAWPRCSAVWRVVVV
jgi:hypothetical protein